MPQLVYEFAAFTRCMISISTDNYEFGRRLANEHSQQIAIEESVDREELVNCRAIEVSADEFKPKGLHGHRHTFKFLTI
jgi:hypothetical protein